MSQTADTVQNILERVSDIKGETSTNTDAKRIRDVSEAERIFANRRLWLVHLLRNQTTTGDGTNDYTIGTATYPMRLKGLAEVFVGDQTESSRHTTVDFFKFQNLVNNNSAVQIAYEWYDQTNDIWKMHINPAPDTGDTIYYSHFYIPPKRTAVGDTVICPDINAVIKHALGLVYQSEEEIELADKYKTEAEQIIKEIMGRETTPAHNQTYGMGAQASSTKIRGIGGY